MEDRQYFGSICPDPAGLQGDSSCLGCSRVAAGGAGWAYLFRCTLGRRDIANRQAVSRALPIPMMFPLPVMLPSTLQARTPARRPKI